MDPSHISILSLVTPKGAAVGTGLLQIIRPLKDQLNGAVDDNAKKAILRDLPGLFGDYPFHDDIAPSAIFVVLFSVMALGHFFVFAKNYSRGQRFWWSFGLGFYCLFRVIGFGMRISWAQDVFKVQVGIASTVFSLVSVLYVKTMNVLLSHRIFTWRHPETGHASWFNLLMIQVYFIVIGVIVMAILGQAVPFIYFLSESHFNMCKKVARAAAILELFYAVAALLLIVLAFAIPAGQINHKFMNFKKKTPQDELPPTVQATWIEKTSLFYYPEKGSQRTSYKGGLLGKAIRVMPSASVPASGLTVLQHEPHHNGPRISMAIILVVITSLILTMNCSFRLASVFVNKTRGDSSGVPFSSWIFRNYIFYIFYGAFEIVVNVLYLVFRVDLRFYIPDRPRKARFGVASSLSPPQTSTDYSDEPKFSAEQPPNSVPFV
ncbi:hypothetical protein TRVA0_002S00408 [Trichomonascus vanleenenianus]|uniref:DUF3112 domain-containing protein n=1 Tax=Trichomonascus vanleenenianus TaxID=2268995 RepID=UPI003ECA4947